MVRTKSQASIVEENDIEETVKVQSEPTMLEKIHVLLIENKKKICLENYKV